MHFETFSQFCDFVSNYLDECNLENKNGTQFSFWVAFLSKVGLGWSILLILVLPVFCADQKIILNSYLTNTLKIWGRCLQKV